MGASGLGKQGSQLLARRVECFHPSLKAGGALRSSDIISDLSAAGAERLDLRTEHDRYDWLVVGSEKNTSIFEPNFLSDIFLRQL